jgi:formiminotetrahydrofolate cyclodeaminase
MVIAYSQPKVGEVPELTEVANLLRTGRLEFLEDVDADARAYDGVRAARSQMKANTDDLDRRRAWVTAVRGAIAVPLGVARRATGLHAALARVGPQTKELLRSDFLSALALFTAAETGGLANAEVNIGDLEGAGEDASGIRAEIARLRASELE